MFNLTKTGFLKNIFIFYLLTSTFIVVGSSASENLVKNKIANNSKNESNKEQKNILLVKDIQINLNQTVFLKTQNLRIKFVKVIEDSRCPADSQCIWAGEVKVKINIIYDKKNSRDFELALSNLPDLSIKKIGKYSIKLENVKGGSSSKDHEPYSIVISLYK